MVYEEEIINSVKDILVNKEESIAVAESVTAVNLQAAFSAGIEASKYFREASLLTISVKRQGI